MKEIRLHGRGGQGLAMASEILGAAFLFEGKYASSFPLYGTERRGAPVSSFVRCDDSPIRVRTRTYAVDCLIVGDQSLLKLPPVLLGLRPGAMLLLNASALPERRPHDSVKTVGVVNATDIGLAEVGVAVTNTAMLGAFARATGWVTIDSLIKSLGEHFQGDRLNRNIRCVQRGFEEVKIRDFQGV